MGSAESCYPLRTKYYTKDFGYDTITAHMENFKRGTCHFDVSSGIYFVWQVLSIVLFSVICLSLHADTILSRFSKSILNIMFTSIYQSLTRSFFC